MDNKDKNDLARWADLIIKDGNTIDLNQSVVHDEITFELPPEDVVSNILFSSPEEVVEEKFDGVKPKKKKSSRRPSTSKEINSEPNSLMAWANIIIKD